MVCGTAQAVATQGFAPRAHAHLVPLPLLVGIFEQTFVSIAGSVVTYGPNNSIA